MRLLINALMSGYTQSERPSLTNGFLSRDHAGARTTAALRNFQEIKNRLRRNSFQAVVADLTAEALKTDAPGFRILCLCLGLGPLHLFPPRQHSFPPCSGQIICLSSVQAKALPIRRRLTGGWWQMRPVGMPLPLTAVASRKKIARCS